MEIVNATGMVVRYTLGVDPEARESVVVVIKGAFNLPTDGSDPVLLDQQIEPVMADEFTGEPGFSSTLYETDFAPTKRYCDVLLNGSAYAPQGRPAERVAVELSFDGRAKRLEVHGDRIWQGRMLSPAPSAPIPFVAKRISYDIAFGGSDTDPSDPTRSKTFNANPFGVGYYPLTTGDAIIGKVLPNTSEIGRRVDEADGQYVPMAFGPVGRVFPQRLAFAGTYDGHWLDNVFPFLPGDFDDRYFQAAPRDQQFPYPQGGELIVLTNLTPQGRTAFRLPRLQVPVEFVDASFEPVEQQARLDTVVIEPDHERFTLTWRASHRLKRNMLEMRQCVVGRMSQAWYRARERGKTYYPSLGALGAER